MALSKILPASQEQYVGARNLIINGNMALSQRNGTSSVTPTSTSYTVDRWKATIAASSKISVQQSSTAPADFYKSVLITSLASTTVGSSDYYLFQQQIEGQNMAHLNWGTADAQSVTLSFWVRSSLTGTFGGSLGNSAFNHTHPFEYTISAANTWQKKEVTISGPTSGTWLSTNGIGIQLMIGLGSGSTYSGPAGSWAAAGYQTATGATQLVATSGATLYITGVQLEVGEATPFEHELFAVTQQKCFRYYYDAMYGNNDGQAYSTARDAQYGHIRNCIAQFPVEMRATPSVSIQSGSANSMDRYGRGQELCYPKAENIQKSHWQNIVKYTSAAQTTTTNWQDNGNYINRAGYKADAEL